MRRQLRLFFTGFSMGTADLIPGVSGGTIAFLSGIYEELLYSIKLITGDVIRLVLRGKITQAIRLIPFKFLTSLGIGLITAVLILSNIFSYLLSNHPVFVWSFFFGLVLASTYVVLKRIVKWDTSDKIAFVASATVAFIIVGIVPVQTPLTPIFIFASGMIAISAMILPGISGSFILLLIGKYQQILEAVTQRDVATLAIFAVGCIVGLAIFARILTWLFAKHHDISIAILAGLMLGSVRKLWPWKETVETRINSHGEIVPLVEKNIMPQNFDISTIFAFILTAFAIILVYYLNKVKVIKEQTEDIDNKKFEKIHKSSVKNQ